MKRFIILFINIIAIRAIKQIFPISVLIPYEKDKNYRVPVIIRGYQGCYSWYLQRPEIFSIRPLTKKEAKSGNLDPDIKVDEYKSIVTSNLNKNECYNEIVVLHTGTVVEEKITSWLFGKDLTSGNTIKSEVILAHIFSISIETTAKAVSLNGYETLAIKAYDNEGNVFTSLESLVFNWEIEKNDILQISSIYSDIYKPTAIRKNLEYNKRFSDIILVKGLQTGISKITATLVTSNQLSNIKNSTTLYVNEPFIPIPSRISILTNTTFPASVIILDDSMNNRIADVNKYTLHSSCDSLVISKGTNKITATETGTCIVNITDNSNEHNKNSLEVSIYNEAVLKLSLISIKDVIPYADLQLLNGNLYDYLNNFLYPKDNVYNTYINIDNLQRKAFANTRASNITKVVQNNPYILVTKLYNKANNANLYIPDSMFFEILQSTTYSQLELLGRSFNTAFFIVNFIAEVGKKGSIDIELNKELTTKNKVSPASIKYEIVNPISIVVNSRQYNGHDAITVNANFFKNFNIDHTTLSSFCSNSDYECFSSIKDLNDITDISANINKKVIVMPMNHKLIISVHSPSKLFEVNSVSSDVCSVNTLSNTNIQINTYDRLGTTIIQIKDKLNPNIYFNLLCTVTIPNNLYIELDPQASIYDANDPVNTKHLTAKIFASYNQTSINTFRNFNNAFIFENKEGYYLLDSCNYIPNFQGITNGIPIEFGISSSMIVKKIQPDANMSAISNDFCAVYELTRPTKPLTVELTAKLYDINTGTQYYNTTKSVIFFPIFNAINEYQNKLNTLVKNSNLVDIIVSSSTNKKVHGNSTIVTSSNMENSYNVGIGSTIILSLVGGPKQTSQCSNNIKIVTTAKELNHRLSNTTLYIDCIDIQPLGKLEIILEHNCGDIKKIYKTIKYIACVVPAHIGLINEKKSYDLIEVNFDAANARSYNNYQISVSETIKYKLFDNGTPNINNIDEHLLFHGQYNIPCNSRVNLSAVVLGENLLPLASYNNYGVTFALFSKKSQKPKLKRKSWDDNSFSILANAKHDCMSDYISVVYLTMPKKITFIDNQFNKYDNLAKLSANNILKGIQISHREYWNKKNNIYYLVSGTILHAQEKFTIVPEQVEDYLFNNNQIYYKLHLINTSGNIKINYLGENIEIVSDEKSDQAISLIDTSKISLRQNQTKEILFRLVNSSNITTNKLKITDKSFIDDINYIEISVNSTNVISCLISIYLENEKQIPIKNTYNIEQYAEYEIKLEYYSYNGGKINKFLVNSTNNIIESLDMTNIEILINTPNSVIFKFKKLGYYSINISNALLTKKQLNFSVYGPYRINPNEITLLPGNYKYVPYTHGGNYVNTYINDTRTDVYNYEQNLANLMYTDTARNDLIIIGTELNKNCSIATKNKIGTTSVYAIGVSSDNKKIGPNNILMVNVYYPTLFETYLNNINTSIKNTIKLSLESINVINVKIFKEINETKKEFSKALVYSDQYYNCYVSYSSSNEDIATFVESRHLNIYTLSNRIDDSPYYIDRLIFAKNPGETVINVRMQCGITNDKSSYSMINVLGTKKYSTQIFHIKVTDIPTSVTLNSPLLYTTTEIVRALNFEKVPTLNDEISLQQHLTDFTREKKKLNKFTIQNIFKLHNGHFSNTLLNSILIYHSYLFNAMQLSNNNNNIQQSSWLFAKSIFRISSGVITLLPNYLYELPYELDVYCQTNDKNFIKINRLSAFNCISPPLEITTKDKKTILYANNNNNSLYNFIKFNPNMSTQVDTSNYFQNQIVTVKIMEASWLWAELSKPLTNNTITQYEIILHLFDEQNNYILTPTELNVFSFTNPDITHIRISQLTFNTFSIIIDTKKKLQANIVFYYKHINTNVQVTNDLNIDRTFLNALSTYFLFPTIGSDNNNVNIVYKQYYDKFISTWNIGILTTIIMILLSSILYGMQKYYNKKNHSNIVYKIRSQHKELDSYKRQKAERARKFFPLINDSQY